MGAGHHIFGPSSLERRMLCPGSYHMELPLWLKPEEKSEDSEEGKLLHAVLAGGVNLPAVPLTQEQEIVIERCREIIAEYKNASGISCCDLFEMQLAADDGFGNELFEGTLDLLTMDKAGVYTVIDWKFGRNRVETAAENIQLAAYALAAHDWTGTEKVTVRVFQPRVKGGDSSYTYLNFEAIRANIREIVALCKKSNAQCFPGEKQCRYCKAKDTCAARLNKAQEIMIHPEALPPVAEWKDDQLGEWYNRFCQLTKFGAVVKNELKTRAEKNGACAGWGIKGSGSTREIPDILSAYKLARTNGISESEFLEVCTVSAPQLEAALAAKAVEKATAASVKLSKKDAKADAAALIAGVCTFKEKAAQLERLSA